MLMMEILTTAFSYFLFLVCLDYEFVPMIGTASTAALLLPHNKQSNDATWNQPTTIYNQIKAGSGSC